MADLNVVIGADASQYNRAMQGAAQTATQTATVMQTAATRIATSVAASGGQVVNSSNRSAYALTNLSRVAQDAPFGFIAIQNNISPLVDSFGSLVRETGSVRGALTGMVGALAGPAGIGLAIAAVTSLITVFIQHQQSANKALKEAKGGVDEYRKALQEQVNSSSDELAHLQVLYEATQNDAIAKGQRLQAVKELQSEYPAYFGNMSREAILAGDAAGAYDRLTQSIINKAVAQAGEKSLADSLKPLIELTAQLQAQQFQLDKAYKQTQKSATDSAKANKQTTTGFRPVTTQATRAVVGGTIVQDENGDLQSLEKYKNDIQDKIKANAAAIQTVLETYGLGGVLKRSGNVDKVKTEAKTIIEQLEAELKQLQDQENKWINDGNKVDFFNLTARERNINAIITKIEQLKEADKGALAPTVFQTGKRGIDIDTTLQGGKDQDKTISQMQETVKQMNALSVARGAANKDQKDLNKEMALGTEGALMFGQALTGAFSSAIQGGQSFISAMGQFLLQLIERLIAAAAAAAILAALLSVTSFGASTATGLGGFAGIFGQLSGFTALVPKHADGGITSRAHLAMVGEGREREAILPLSKLNQFVQTNGGGGIKEGQIVGVMRGSDLLLQYKRAEKSKGRLQ